MHIDEARLKSILLQENYVTEGDIAKAAIYADAHRTTFDVYLLSEGLLTKDLLGQAIAESFKIPYADLNSRQPSQEQVLRIPENTAVKFRAVLFNENDTESVIATDDPEQKDILAELQTLFPKKKITIAYALPEDVDAVFTHYQKPLETRFSKIIEKQSRIAPEILDEIFLDALVFSASDIHFEPRSAEILVRFRVDGVLRDAGRIPREYYENIVNRIKVVSRLRIDEHFSAQDGSMRFEKDGRSVDLRTSIIPTVEGEKVVLRVLAAYIQGLGLENLGLSKENQKILENAVQKPFGMVLVAGPTGSGKTTTLYALLKILNRPDVNITTIEDPVEYKMVGVNQIQTNMQTGLTFAKGLRSIVRQDPDIILVGEIRDEETVEIAVNAALTGHILFSTFHANDAATAIPRLLDMKVEPFLLASTLELLIAQRLVRKICETCRYSITVPSAELAKKARSNKSYFQEKTVTLYRGKGCVSCGGSGYKGRTAIFEFIQVTPEMEELILQNPSAQNIWKLARTQGSLPLFEDGIEKVRNGVTTFEELLRVAEPPAHNHNSHDKK